MKLCFLLIAFCFLYSIHRAYSLEIVPYHIFEISALCADFTPDGKYIVISGYTGYSPGSSNGVLFYDIEDFNLSKVLPAALYSDFQFSPDGTMLIGGVASAGPYEGGADLWDVTANQLIHTFTPFNIYEKYGDVHTAISPDKKSFLTDKIPAGFCTPTLWSTTTFQEIHFFFGYAGVEVSNDPNLESQFAFVDDGGVSLAFSPDGESVLIDDNIYSMPTCKYECSLDLQNVVHDTDFSPDGSWLIVSDRSETLNGRERIVIWDWKTKSKIDTLYESTETGAPYAAYVDISPDNRFLASGMRNGELWIWDISKKDTLIRLKLRGENHYPKPQFSPDNKYLLSVGEITKNNWTSRCVYLWRMSDILQTSSVPNFSVQK